MELKENDVFKFRFNQKYLKSIHEPYWAFDGTLISKKSGDSFLLFDTYWGTSSDNKRFTLEEALEKGTLEFVCNLDEVDKATKDVELYYDESDYYHLNMHHGHYDKWYLKRGAQKSVNKMIENIEYKIKVEEDKSESAKRSAEYYKNMLDKVKSGDMSVYI